VSFLAPAVFFFVLMTIVPVVMMVWLSFHESNLITTRYVGLSNYVRMFTDKRLLGSLVNTLLYTAIIAPAITALCVGVALVVHSLPKHWQQPARLVIYAPMMTAGVVISGAWRWIFSPREGLANWLLSLVGAQPVVWFSTRLTSIPTISFIHTITYVGGMAIIVTAALKAVGTDVLDAAKIDGASQGRIVRSIYLPSIAPTVALVFLMASMGAMQIFEWIYMLAQVDGAITVMYSIYHEGFLYAHQGMASAQSVMLVVVVGLMAFAQRRFQTWQSI
jgi:multiple sugar transport system permease protein